MLKLVYSGACHAIDLKTYGIIKMNPTLDVIVVYKKNAKPDDVDKGWLYPVFTSNEDGSFSAINIDLYPDNIFISKGYSDIDSSYSEGELFILERHMQDEERTTERGINQYFSMGHFAKPIKPNTLIPVMQHQLPPREDGFLPDGVQPPKGIFFIKDADSIYGPLTASRENDIYKVSPKVTQVLRGVSNDSVAVFLAQSMTSIVISAIISGREKLYIQSLQCLSSFPFDQMDYISDERLVTFFGNMEYGKNAKLLAKREAQRLQDGLKKQRKYNLVSSERLKRLECLLDSYLNDTDTGSALVKNYLKNTNNGAEFLQSFVEKNEKELLDKHLIKIKEDIDRKEQELNSSINIVQQRLESKQRELYDIRDKVTNEQNDADEKISAANRRMELEIAAIEAQTEEEKQRLLAEKQLEKQAEIKELEDEINQLKNEKEQKQMECDKILSQFKQLQDLTKLDEEKKYYHRQIDDLQRAVRVHETTLSDPGKLSEAMAEVKLVNDILSGRSVSDTPEINVKPAPELASKQPTKSLELVEKISAYFEDDGGRIFSLDEMTNILVSLSQSFLTVFSGPPGVGKTSTAVRLAESLHLGNVDGEQNFLYIPVGRGWVSSRDIIGFYNSLKGGYQPARTGLYDFLKRNELEEYKVSPRFVLLDEANLSSMEHYWSDFLGMCDPEGRSRFLDTGNPERAESLLSVGDNVRFIATINNDATTERLSPRLIDRVPVITLDSDSISSSNVEQLIKLDGAIEYQKLKDFYFSSAAEPSSSDTNRLKSIIEILKSPESSLGQPILISPRKVMAINNYCAVASPLMETDDALDFAVAQHVLPHIEGFGANFRKRLEKLRDEFGNDLPRSKKILDRILSTGCEFTNSYSFF